MKKEMVFDTTAFSVSAAYSPSPPTVLGAVPCIKPVCPVVCERWSLKQSSEGAPWWKLSNELGLLAVSSFLWLVSFLWSKGVFMCGFQLTDV